MNPDGIDYRRIRDELIYMTYSDGWVVSVYITIRGNGTVSGLAPFRAIKTFCRFL